MASPGNPDLGQFGAAPGSAPYHTGQNYQPNNGITYPPPPGPAPDTTGQNHQPNNRSYPPPPPLGPAPYPTGDNYQHDNGSYPTPPHPDVSLPTYQFPQNPSIFPTQYQPGMSQQSTYIVGTVRPVVTQPYNAPIQESYVGHMVFACIVFWCCGWLFGGIAFILAMLASNSAGDGPGNDAKRLGQASMTLSSAGLILGVIAWGLIIWAIVSTNSGSGCRYYTCGGSCYNYKSYYYTRSSCSSSFYSSCYSYSNGYCYY